VQREDSLERHVIIPHIPCIALDVTPLSYLIVSCVCECSELKQLMEANFLQGGVTHKPPASKPSAPARKAKKKARVPKKGLDQDEYFSAGYYTTTEVDLWPEAVVPEAPLDKKAQAKKDREAAKARRKLSDDSKKKEKEEKKRERRGRSRSGGKTNGGVEGVQEHSGEEGPPPAGLDQKSSRIASIRRLNFFNLRGSSNVDGSPSPHQVVGAHECDPALN
jgi:hypothetical protein